MVVEVDSITAPNPAAPSADDDPISAVAASPPAAAVVVVAARVEAIDFNADALVAARPADAEAATVVPVELPPPAVVAAIVDVAAPLTAAVRAVDLDHYYL